MVRKVMTKVVLRLTAEGRSERAIAASEGMSRDSVAAVFEAAERGGLDWDGVAGRPDIEVCPMLFPGRGGHQSVFAQSDWSAVHRQVTRVGGDTEVASCRVRGRQGGRWWRGDELRPVL